MKPLTYIPSMKQFFVLAALVLMSIVSSAVQATQQLTYDASGELLSIAAAGSSAPQITSQPQGGILTAGEPFALSVGVSGVGPFTFQWRKAGSPLAGATNGSLVFAEVSKLDVGVYTVAVSNSFGGTISNPAELGLEVNPFSQPLGSDLANWTVGGSSAWQVLTGTNMTRDGFAVGMTDNYIDESYLEGRVVLTNMMTLRFWARSFYGHQTYLSLFQFYVNDGLKFSVPYINDWREFVVHLPPGTHDLRWVHNSQMAGFALDQISFTPAPDTDLDGLSDDWEVQYFGSLSPLSTEDSDQDGNSHLVEYYDVTNPTQFNSLYIHLRLSTNGVGTISHTPPEPRTGYAFGRIDFSATPGPNQIFAGWTGVRTNFFSDLALFPGASGYLPGLSLVITGNFSPVIPLGEALDDSALSWTAGGELPFVGRNGFSSVGNDSVFTGPIYKTNGLTRSWLEATVPGPRTIRYQGKHLRGTTYQWVTFEEYVDGESEVTSYLAYQDWQTNVVHVPPGSHTVRIQLTQTNITDESWIVAFIDDMKVAVPLDSDSDGMSDEWEMQYFNTISRDGTGDNDSDGVNDLTEYLEHTHPGTETSLRARVITSVTGNGTVTKTPDKPYYRYAEKVQFTAVPAPGWTLLSWTGMTNIGDFIRYATNDTFEIGIYKGFELTANFVPKQQYHDVLETSAGEWISSYPRWFPSTNMTHDGVDALETPGLLPYGVTNATLSMTVTGPKIVSFWWKTDMRKNLGSLTFQGAGQNITVQGFHDWERVFVQVPVGSHQLNWIFTNLIEFGSALDNRGWLDQVLIGDDADQDGIADNWENTNFGNTAAATGAGDPDNDKINNQNEWADGTNPNLATSARYHVRVVRENEWLVDISPRQAFYTNGAQVTLTAAGSLTGWSGDASGSANPLVLTLTSNKTIVANFDALALGADATNLLFTTGGAAAWSRHTDIDYDYAFDDDLIRSGSGLAANAESWFEVTLQGPGKIDFLARPYHTSGGHLRWELDGATLVTLPYQYYSPVRYAYYIPAGQHVVRWVHKQGNNPNDFSYIDHIRWTAYEDYSLAAALDTTGVTWVSTNDLPWRGQTAVSHDGVDAAVISGLPPSESAVLQTTVSATNVTILSFWWKNLTENFDALQFKLDGAEVGSIQTIYGAKDWTLVTLQLTPGEHTLSWILTQSYSGNGANSAYIDEVRIQPIITSTLAQALDNTNLTWNATGGNWSGQNIVTHDGVDAAGTGETGLSQTNRLQTPVIGPGTLSFWWKVSCENFWDKLAFYYDGVQSSVVLPITGEKDWTFVTLNIPSGSHTVGWYYIKDSFGSAGSDKGWVDQVVWTPTTPVVTVPLATALDTPGRTWITGGSDPWIGVSNSAAADLIDMAVSGTVGNSQSSYIESSFAGPGELSFWWKVSSEAGFDFLRFTMDGLNHINAPGISGVTEWTNIVVPIPAGSHVVRWTYVKDTSDSAGEDKGWLDHVTYTGSTNQPVRFKLNLAVAPTNSGTLFVLPSSPDGFYNSNQTVSVSAIPASGKKFLKWSGASTATTNVVSIVMNANKTLTATFTNLPPSYLLTTSVTPVGGGYVTTTPYSADNTFVANTAVSLQATPYPGYKFVKWTGAVVTNKPTARIVMKGPRTAQAVFQALPRYTLQTTVFPPGAGTVQVSPFWPSNSYPLGTVLTLTAVPTDTNIFAAWIGAPGFTNVTTVTITTNKSIGAIFDNRGQFLFQNTNGQMAVWFMNQTQQLASIVLPAKVKTTWKMVGTGDFDKNGAKDILFSSGAQAAAWLLAGNISTNSTFLRGGTNMTGYKLCGSADFDGNGVSDLLWQSKSGALRTWMMDSVSSGTTAIITNVVPLGWTALAVPDLNNDQQQDILLQHSTGKLTLWAMNGLNRVAEVPLNNNVAPPKGYTARGVTDLNNDGKGDIVFQSAANGRILVWMMDGTVVTQAVPLSAFLRPASWALRGIR